MKTIIIVFITLIISTAHASDVEISLVNVTEQKLIYTIYWVDHPYDDYNQPAMLACGELAPMLEPRTFSYPPGKWCITWRSMTHKEPKISVLVCFISSECVSRVHVTPYDFQFE